MKRPLSDAVDVAADVDVVAAAAVAAVFAAASVLAAAIGDVAVVELLAEMLGQSRFD